ncbi:MAG: hypothetical protein QOC96_1739 [Acidobacteriota bacterium]|jgi:poly-gamma-glutamate synthesis protein (capsule biosynthesis protein)|nr:hypothetical protein [Acidobacteriota bacterium]
MKTFRSSLLVCLLAVCLTVLLCFGCQKPDASQANSSSANAPTKVEETAVTFLAVGDIMLSRGVAMAIDRANDPLMPFKRLAPLFKSTDFNFGNLESPVSGNDRINGHNLTFNAHTKDLVGLTEYNFKVLNLANNHAFDQHLAGSQFTQKILAERGITYLGVGDSLEQAWQPKVFTINNLRIGFIGASYASFNDGGVTRNDYVARIEDHEYLKKAIEQLKSQSDFIIVTMHAGTEYQPSADPRRALDRAQIDFAHAAVDYGADLVIGAHPHWIQNLEQYNGKYIFYSLGNFIFDMRDPIANQGLVLKITLKGQRTTNPSSSATGPGAGFATHIEQIECIPVMIENNSTPRLATEAEAERILKRVGLPQKVIGNAGQAK